MKPKLLPLLEECVSDGLHLGFNRAHKHNDKPKPSQILEAQQQAIMNEFFERFDFDFSVENEFDRMVRRGTDAWADVDDNWLEDLRGGKDES